MPNAAKSPVSKSVKSSPGTAKPRPPRPGAHRVIAAAKAKAEFLSLIEQVSTDGRPLIVTKRGKPLVQIVPLNIAPVEHPFGCMKGSVRVHGDIVGPEPDIWEAMA